MYFNFQQYRVSRSIKTMCTNIFAKKCKLQKIATTNSIFFNRLLKTCIIIKRPCIRIFGKIGLADQSKPCKLIYLEKIASCRKIATTNINF